MTHKPVFLEIAEAYATPPEERTEKQYNLTEAGICNAASIGLSRRKHRRLMTVMVRMNPHKSLSSFWWPIRIVNRLANVFTKHPLGNHTREHDFLRCTLSLLFAAMSVKDFLEMLGGE